MHSANASRCCPSRRLVDQPEWIHRRVHVAAQGRTGRSSIQRAERLTAEFLGDYVYAAATRTYGTAVWNDSRNGADCPAIDNYRTSLRSGPALPAPAPQQDCPTQTFGNSDIYGGTFTDPTP